MANPTRGELHCETAIIGGGISGLACARRLHELGRPMALFTRSLGGRLLGGPTGANLGASYATADYHHVGAFLETDPGQRLGDVATLVDGEPRSVTRMAHSHPFLMARLLGWVRRVRRHHNRVRRRMHQTCQRELLLGDPVISELARTPASEFVEANGLQELDRLFLGAIARSTLFVPTAELDAFLWLATLYPFVVRCWRADARSALEGISAGWRHAVHHDTISSLQHLDGALPWRLEGEQATIRATNVVISTPVAATRRFAPLLAGEARQVPVRTLHVRGKRRPPYAGWPALFLPPPHPITVLWRGSEGLDILFDLGRTDLGIYYEEVEVLAEHGWESGVQLPHGEWRPLNPTPGLYTVGDYNVCGLEDSFLTGLFAAQHIGERTR